MNRHIKSFLTFTGGAVTGLIFGGAGVIVAEISSEKIRHALKKELYDWIGDALFYEKNRAKVSYHTYYDNRRSQKDKSMFIPFTEAVYMRRTDAEAFADALEQVADKYDIVTLSDYYEIAGLDDKNSFNATLYGWYKSDIYGAKIEKRTRKGYGDEYYVALPMPKKLEA